MTWFVLSLIAILFWSGSDLFSKMGSKPDDKYSHWKMVMAVGAVMGLHAIIMLALGTPFHPRDIITYMPASAMYILSMVLGYVGYYVLGYYLKEYTLSRPAEYLIYLLGIAGAAVTVGGTAWLSQQRGALAQTFYNYDSPNIALMSTAVFVLFRYLLGVSDERSRRQRFSGVAKVSFGIYLVHVFFLMLLRNFGITALSFPPVLSVPVLRRW